MHFTKFHADFASLHFNIIVFIQSRFFYVFEDPHTGCYLDLLCIFIQGMYIVLLCCALPINVDEDPHPGCYLNVLCSFIQFMYYICLDVSSTFCETFL